MRPFNSSVFIVLCVTGCATAQQSSPTPMPTTPVATTRPSAGPAASESVDATLDRLETVGKSLQDFTADATLTTIDSTSGSETARSGKVYYQTRQGDARIRVSFDTHDKGDRQYEEKIEYVLTGGVLVDRNYETKVEVRRQVMKPGEKVNLLKLGEGPFPLPIGQDKAQVHELFDVTRVDAAAGEPQDTTHLKLVPKPDTHFASKFAGIDVWVDNATHFPVRIDTADANETNVRQTRLENVKMNTGLTDADFTLPAVEGWNVRTEEYTE